MPHGAVFSGKLGPRQFDGASLHKYPVEHGKNRIVRFSRDDFFVAAALQFFRPEPGDATKRPVKKNKPAGCIGFIIPVFNGLKYRAVSLFVSAKPLLGLASGGIIP